MGETPPRYRTLDRPGPGLATIAEPDGRVGLWSRTMRGGTIRTCSRCGVATGLFSRPSLYRKAQDTPRLCRPCVEGTARAARESGG